MSIVGNIMQQPLSDASTVAVSSTLSEQEPDLTTNTQLGKALVQKDASERSSICVLRRCILECHYRNEQDKMVQFKGLYVVRGPTDSKHVRYTMEITVNELQLQGRCIQRFHSFFLLRKNLLEVLKTCRGRLPSALPRVEQEPQLTAGAELVKILSRPRCIQCSECESTYDQLLAIHFPRRTLFPPSLQDVNERSQMLETFLDYCVRLATSWPACQRSQRLFTAALGKFLGMDMKAYLVAQKEDDTVSDRRTVVSVNIHDDKEQSNESLKTKLKSQSSDYEDDCRSEPNFSFISNPPKEDIKDAGLVRSKSHC
ncbi:unnamed protein product [Peronospora farinosa]|uniref:PX domain-containing protein n=1 Tax=Peronospora farinosa TaxID=134698 RepID=A0AAV0UV98_9STRA|nr:unnamed protein product [Peronospora farinosa]CAI5740857.1 unnamed protein product [Peronospora farinosa]